MEDNNYCAGESDDQERSHTTSEGFHCQSHSASFEWGIPFLVVGFASRPIRNVWSNLVNRNKYCFDSQCRTKQLAKPTG